MADQYESHNSGDSTYQTILTSAYKAQTFTATSDHDMNALNLKLYRDAGGVGTIYASIRNTSGGAPTGGDLAVGSMDSEDLTTNTNGAWYLFNLSGTVSLTNGTKYAIVVGCPVGATAKNWRCSSDSSYAGGGKFNSSDSGATWGSENTVYDCMFEVWYYASSVAPPGGVTSLLPIGVV